MGAREESTFTVGWLEELLEYLEEGTPQAIRHAVRMVRNAIKRLTKKA